MALLEDINESGGSFDNLVPMHAIMRSDSLTGHRLSSVLRQLCHDLFSTDERDMLKSSLRNYRKGAISLCSLCDCLGKLTTNSSRMAVVEIIAEMMESKVKSEFLAQCKRKILFRNKKNIMLENKCRRSATINIAQDYNYASQNNPSSVYYSPQLCRRGDNEFDNGGQMGSRNSLVGRDVHRAPHYSTPSLSTLPEESSESAEDVHVTQLYSHSEERTDAPINDDRERGSLTNRVVQHKSEDNVSSSTESISSQSSNSSATVEQNPAYTADSKLGSICINGQGPPLTIKMQPPQRPPLPNLSDTQKSYITKNYLTASNVRKAQENTINITSSLFPYSEHSNIMISVADNSIKSHLEREVSSSSSIKSIKEPPILTSEVIDRPRKIGVIVEKDNIYNYAVSSFHPIIRRHTPGIIKDMLQRNVVSELKHIIHQESDKQSIRCVCTQTGHPLRNNAIQTEFIGLMDKGIQTTSKIQSLN